MDDKASKSGRPMRWLDLLLTIWVVVVAVVYYGGYFIPAVGALTPNASAFYAFMVLVSVLTLMTRYLRRNEADTHGTDTNKEDVRTKNRK